MVRPVAGDLPEQVKNNQSVNTAAGNGGQKMSQYSWFTVYDLGLIPLRNVRRQAHHKQFRSLHFIWSLLSNMSVLIKRGADRIQPLSCSTALRRQIMKVPLCGSGQRKIVRHQFLNLRHRFLLVIFNVVQGKRLRGHDGRMAFIIIDAHPRIKLDD